MVLDKSRPSANRSSNSQPWTQLHKEVVWGPGLAVPCSGHKPEGSTLEGPHLARRKKVKGRVPSSSRSHTEICAMLGYIKAISFLFFTFLRWLLENLKSHMWLTSGQPSYWTVLV